MNINSALQKKQLLFGTLPPPLPPPPPPPSEEEDAEEGETANSEEGAKKQKKKKKKKKPKPIEVARVPIDYEQASPEEARRWQLAETGVKDMKRVREECFDDSEYEQAMRDALSLSGSHGLRLGGLLLPIVKTTSTGMPSCDGSVLRRLAGDVTKGRYGLAFDALEARFPGGEEGNEAQKESVGVRACKGLTGLLEHDATTKLLSSFILPLQGKPALDAQLLSEEEAMEEEEGDENGENGGRRKKGVAGKRSTKLTDENGNDDMVAELEDPTADFTRIHASLNINTETGRLSCRRPNLQVSREWCRIAQVRKNSASAT